MFFQNNVRCAPCSSINLSGFKIQTSLVPFPLISSHLVDLPHHIPQRKSEKKEQVEKTEDDADDDDVKEEEHDDEDMSQLDEDNDVSEELDIREMRHKIVNLGWFK